MKSFISLYNFVDTYTAGDFCKNRSFVIVANEVFSLEDTISHRVFEMTLKYIGRVIFINDIQAVRCQKVFQPLSFIFVELYNL